MQRIVSLMLGLALLFGVSVAQPNFAEMSDEEIANSVWEMIHDQAYAFTWNYETEPPPGFYEGNEPHGLILRTFMNNIAFNAVQNRLGTFPGNSVIVKENHRTGHMTSNDEEDAENDGDRSVEGFDGDLEAITLMVKLPGYNPDAGDWFWAKYQADGSIDAAGKPEGCIGCHGGVADNDYVFDAVVAAE